MDMTAVDVFGIEVTEVDAPRRRGRAVSYEPGRAAPHGYWVLWSGERRPSWHPIDTVDVPVAAARPDGAGLAASAAS